LTLGFAATGAAHAQTPVFVSDTVPLGQVLPATLNAVDVNGDTYLDLVCCGKTNANVPFVKAFIGDTIGGLAPEVISTPSAPVASCAAGDFDLDGKLDLVLGLDTPSAPGSVAIHAGNGFGSFTAAGSQTLFGRPGLIAVGDVNGDGKLDVAAVDFLTPGSGVAKLFLGDGLGGLGAPTTLGNANNQVAFADMNGDAKLDLILASDGTADFKTYLGDGLGAFGSPNLTPTPAVPDGLAVGDVNGDGNLDVVLTLIFQAGIQAYLGDGLGSFGAPISSTATSGLTRLALGDVNGDGKLDLGGAVGASNVGTFHGAGNGSFAVSGTFAAGFLPRGFVFFDMDKDGRLDMASVNLATPVLSTYYNFVAPVGLTSYGTGTPGCNGAHTLTGNKTPRIGTSDFQLRCDNTPLSTLGIAIVTNVPDFAGSDPFGINVLLHVDLIFATEVYPVDFYSTAAGNGAAPLPVPFVPQVIGLTYYAMGLWVWAPGCPAVQPNNLSTTKGLSLTLQAPGASGEINLTTLATVAAGTAPSAVEIVDIDNDFVSDLLVANGTTSQVSVLVGTGGVTYAAPTAAATGLDATALTTGDWNADGKADFASADTGANAVTAALGDGLGAFTTSGSPAVGTAPVAIATADLDNDGKLDLLVVNRDSNDATPLIGDGLGAFTAGTPIALGTSPRGLILLDLSGDAKPDLVVACSGIDSLQVGLGDGLGGFGSLTSHAVGVAPVSVASGDLDNDGKADLAVANSGSSSVSILGGDGLGGFGASAAFAAGTAPIAVRIADANRDLRQDVLVVNRDSNNLSVLLGNYSLTPLAGLAFPVGTTPLGLDAFVPGFDGKLRIYTANSGSGDLTILAAP
jgi:hypothetical protein